MNNINENEEFYVSYTKLDTYKSCPKKYEYKYIQRLESKSIRRTTYIGSDIHKLIELLYAERTKAIKQARLDKHLEFAKENDALLKALPELKTEELKAMLTNPDYQDDPEFLQHAEKVVEAREKYKELFEDTLTWREYLVGVIRPKFLQMSDENKAELGLTYIEDLAVIMAQYEYYYTNDNLTVIDLEHNKKCNLGSYNNKKVILTFICDGIITANYNGKTYILEHKTYKDDPMTFEDTWLNTQTAIYVSALRAQGWNIEGVLWDNIKSTAPKEPKILKNGSYGKQTNNVTLFSFVDWDTIMEGPGAVIDKVNSLMANKEIMELDIEGNKDNFISRHITVFNERAVDILLEDTAIVCNEVTKEHPTIYRNLGWTCNNCKFKDLCKAEMVGQDSQMIKDTMYTKK